MALQTNFQKLSWFDSLIFGIDMILKNINILYVLYVQYMNYVIAIIAKVLSTLYKLFSTMC